MKKLLVILMVVAMASFLFVGCLPGVTPEPEPEPEPTPTPTTVAPVITAIPGISITSTATQYINNTESSLVTVSGTAPTYSEIKVYIDDICAGTGDTGVTGTFSVVIAKADLGADGAKTLYATAKEAGLAVSPKSVEYAFTLDTDSPGITEVKATAAAVAVPGTSTHTAGGTALATSVPTPALVVTGTWLIDILGATATAGNVRITFPDGTIVIYNLVANGAVFAAGAPIPGVTLTFNGAFAAGQQSQVVCTATSVAIAGRATLKYDEDVSFTGATAATCVYGGNLTGAVFAAYKESNDTYYFTGVTAPAVYLTAAITVYGVADLAGNVGGTITSPLSATCMVGVASATALAP